MADIPATRSLARLWLNLSLPGKGSAIVAIPVICTLSMLLVLAGLRRRADAANQWVAHTEQVLAQSSEILAASLSEEATARGYLLTHDPNFLTLHRTARKKVFDGFSVILSATEDNPREQEHMRTAMRLMQEETTALDKELEFLPSPELAASVNASRRRVDAVAAEIAEFEANERLLLTQRRQQVINHRETMRLAFIAFGVIGVFSGIFGSRLFTAGVQRRLERISENAARFAHRESEGPVDGSRDTIGQLERALLGAARSVLEREQRLSQNAAELERAKSAAEAAAKAKSDFVATISHEIRSPMNALLGAGDLLASTSLTEKQAEYIAMLNAAGNNLLSVINEVLDHAKIEAGRLELESVTFDCSVLLDRVVDLLAVSASRKGLELFSKYVPTAPRFVTGDPSRLQRVLVNLVSNAIKFTETGVVAVKIEPADTPGLLHFIIEDTGIGIPRDRQDAIFQKFTQAASSTTREYGGTGLGLAISKQIVELMGGRIWVESDAGAGSTFHFTAALPAASEPVARAAVAYSNGAPHALSARILLAEDSASNVVLMQAYLAGTGCTLDLAGDGEVAMQRLTTGHYNLVLMDVQMPKVDGYEVTRRFREWERAKSVARTPVIAVTAHAFQEDIEQAIKAGADAHLTKPIRRETLLEAIELYQRPDDASNIRVTVPDFIRELAPEFLRRQRYGMLAVSAALRNGEFDPIQSFAHNMKGCGRSFGFPRLTDLGREMETAAKAGNAGALKEQVAVLREYLTAVDIA
jgi:signal transduction histidine kinase/DNA-binding response OmpR family regulator